MSQKNYPGDVLRRPRGPCYSLRETEARLTESPTVVPVVPGGPAVDRLSCYRFKQSPLRERLCSTHTSIL